jgi:hypothetical protein
MERIKLLLDGHRDFLAGFLGFVLLSVLIYVGLSALENRYYLTVRFFIIMGAVGIMSVGKWIIDTVSAS